MKITIYSKQNCGPCIATKSAMKRAGIHFTEVETSESVERLKELGFTSVPVIIIQTEKGAFGWCGYRPEFINKLVAGEPAGIDLGETGIGL